MKGSISNRRSFGLAQYVSYSLGLVCAISYGFSDFAFIWPLARSLFVIFVDDDDGKSADSNTNDRWMELRNKFNLNATVVCAGKCCAAILIVEIHYILTHIPTTLKCYSRCMGFCIELVNRQSHHSKVLVGAVVCSGLLPRKSSCGC